MRTQCGHLIRYSELPPEQPYKPLILPEKMVPTPRIELGTY